MKNVKNVAINKMNLEIFVQTAVLHFGYMCCIIKVQNRKGDTDEQVKRVPETRLNRKTR